MNKNRFIENKAMRKRNKFTRGAEKQRKNVWQEREQNDEKGMKTTRSQSSRINPGFITAN